MAQRTIVTITDDLDDLDGSDDAQSVTFAFKDPVYSVDLTSRNQQNLLKALEPYITAGTVVSRPSRGSRAPRKSHHRPADPAWRPTRSRTPT